MNDRFLDRLMGGYGDTIRNNQSSYGAGVSGAGGLFGRGQMRGLLDSLAAQGAGRSALRFLMDNPAAQMGLAGGRGSAPLTGITPDMIRWMRDSGGSVFQGSPVASNHSQYQTQMFEQFPELWDSYVESIGRDPSSFNGGGNPYRAAPQLPDDTLLPLPVSPAGPRTPAPAQAPGPAVQPPVPAPGPPATIGPPPPGLGTAPPARAGNPPRPPGPAMAPGAMNRGRTQPSRRQSRRVRY